MSRVFLALFLALLWLAVIGHLGIHWRSNPEYYFAWAAPLMLAAILFARWRRFDARSGAAVSRFPPAWSAGALAAGLLAFVPLAVVARANPHWHIASCAFAGLACALTYFAFDIYGGKTYRRHFALPFLLIFAAVPWPYLVESQVIGALRSVNAAATVEVLHLTGVPALRESRDVIALANTKLGIEDGCTGIRSLHLFIALTLFWGELYRLGLKGRLWLVAAGLLLTMVTNLGRTLALAALAVGGGTRAFERWHDLVGTATQLLALALCWLVVDRLVSRRGSPAQGDAVAGSGPVRRFHSNRRGAAILAGASCWMLAAGAATSAWFKYRPQPVAHGGSWELRWPPPLYDCKVESIPGKWEKIMSPDSAFAGSWRNAGGLQRLVYYFRWNEGNVAGRLGATHNPELCLPGAGYELKGKDRVAVQFAGRERSFTRYRFRFRGRELFIFQGIWDDTHYATDASATGEGRWRERLQRAWHGHPHPGQRMLELVFWDSGDAEESTRELNDVLTLMIRSDSPPFAGLRGRSVARSEANP